jgi:hypothetical protein
MRDQLARFLGRDRGKTLELRPGAADRRPLMPPAGLASQPFVNERLERFA